MVVVIGNGPKFSYAFFFLFACFAHKMLATDLKKQKIKPDPKCFYDGRKFRMQC